MIQAGTAAGTGTVKVADFKRFLDELMGAKKEGKSVLDSAKDAGIPIEKE